MGVSNRRPTPSAERLLATVIYSRAQRFADRGDLPRDEAVANLRELAGDRLDLVVEAAGLMLGGHPRGSVTHALYGPPAGLLLEVAGVDEDSPEVQRWVEIGAERHRRHMRRGVND